MGSQVGAFISSKTTSRDEKRWHLSWKSDAQADPASPLPVVWKYGGVEARGLRILGEGELLSGQDELEERRFLGFVEESAGEMTAVWTDEASAAPCDFSNDVEASTHLRMRWGGSDYYLGMDPDSEREGRGRWLRIPEEKQSAMAIRSNRHELCMFIELAEGKAGWKYRRMGGDQWTEPGADEALVAELGDELYFYLQSKEHIRPGDISKVTLGYDSEQNRAPYTAEDLVAYGVFESRDWSLDQCIFAPLGCVRTPGGPEEPPEDGPHLYWWGDVIALWREGTWDISAVAEIEGPEGVQTLDADPRVCIGPGCGNAPNPRGVSAGSV